VIPLEEVEKAYLAGIVDVANTNLQLLNWIRARVVRIEQSAFSARLKNS
jgi:hypothetical protein